MSKPETVRGLTLTEWRDLIVKEIDLTLDRKSRNCLSCEYFQDGPQLCGLNGLMPPPRIAVRGCECWMEDIPF